MWVVNQDNDSVSVFDTDIQHRESPRYRWALPHARWPSSSAGEIWVTNKQSATISVIDSAKPDGESHASRCHLPPNRSASQPHRPVASCTSYWKDQGACSRSTQATMRRSAASIVGPNPRHVSVTGDDSKHLCFPIHHTAVAG